MKIMNAVGRGLRYMLIGFGALALTGSVIAVADYALTQGSGTTFASLVVSSKHYIAMVICDATAGETQCSAVSAAGAVSVAEQNGSAYPDKANFVSGAASATDTAAHTIIAAPGAGIKIYVTGVQCSRDDAGTAAMRVTLNDGASTPVLLPNNGGGGGNNPVFPTPLIVPAATALQFTPSTSTSTVRCSAQGYTAS
jgi:hypothetical protein